LQVDTSKDKMPGQRWDFCWPRNTLQVPKTLHCVVFCLHRSWLFTAHIFFSFNDAVLSSDCCNIEWKCRRVFVLLRRCCQRHLQYIASTHTTQSVTQKLARSTAHSNTVLQTQLLRSYLCHRYLVFMHFIFRRGAIVLYCVTCYRAIDC